jgi:glycosyltransferase involved in cell wall biosynthesis
MMKLALLYTDAFASGGYPRDARWLAGSLSRAGVEVTVFGRLDSPLKTDGLEETIDCRSWKSLALNSRRFDLVHVFGLFSLTHPLGALACASVGVPLVISPVAHLLPLHMAVKRRKKEVFLKVAWMPWIGRASAFHVFSQLEADSVRKRVPDARLFEATLGIFPCANGCDMPDRSRDRERTRHFLFFGRNDVYQKGLDVLLEGYAKAIGLLGIRPKVSVKLTIAGLPWNNSRPYLTGCLRRLGIQDVVTILGEVDEPTKSRLLVEADCLLFLSRWDGPPRPIREAIAAGTPVIVTPETNMGELVEKFGAGLQVGLNAEQVSHGLLRAVLEGDLLENCQRGVQNLKRHLAWDRVAEDYVKGYEEALCRS